MWIQFVAVSASLLLLVSSAALADGSGGDSKSHHSSEAKSHHRHGPKHSHHRSKKQVVRFTVQVEPEALRLEQDMLESETPLTRVRLEPKSGEPVFYNDPPGLPSLPSLARFVALPRGARVASVAVVPSNVVTIPAVPLLAWAQLAQPGQAYDPKDPNDNPNDPGDPNDPQNRYAVPPQFPIDDQQREVFYSSEPVAPDPMVLQLRSYPPQIAVHARPQPVDGIADVLRVDLSPVRWDIAKEELHFATTMEIIVTFEGGRPLRRARTPGQVSALEDLRDWVVNAADLAPAVPIPPRPIDVPYLIITDDHFWTPDFQRTPGANLVEAFEPLAHWKTQKGQRAAVVRISDIVDGVYGDFRTGAADLQETLRNFLKFVERRYRTQWVLLGGDVEIIPARMVTVWAHANAAHYLQRAEEEKPTLRRSYWDASRERVVFNTPDAFDRVLSSRTGRSFTYGAFPSARFPGWRMIDAADCDMTEAPPEARCYELVAPLADIENTNIALVLPENTIPTDLYYSSLRGPAYDMPGVRDWDANGDGLYGTNLWDRSADGVSYTPTVRLGRVPVSSESEASFFVEKLIGYERHFYHGSFGNRMLLAADNWGGGPSARPTTSDVPEEGEFRLNSARTEGIVHFASAPGNAADWKLASWRNSESWSVFRYTRDAGPDVPGYYFCTDVTCSERSEVYWSILGRAIEIPIPTKFVRMFGPSSDVGAAFYFLDHDSLDSAAVEKEQVRDLFTRLFPGITDQQRLYRDIYDIAPAPDLGYLTRNGVIWNLERESFNLISLSGHGWMGGCCGVAAEGIPDLRNAPGLFYADSCLTNEFDKMDAVSELLVTKQYNGAVGYVGNTRFSWVGLGSSYERAFWMRMRSSRELGRLHDTKSRYVSNPNEQWVNFSLNLLGDPAMDVWRGGPGSLSLDVPDEVWQGRRLTGQVRDRASGSPVPLARVTLVGDGVYQVVTANLSGQFSFPPSGSTGQRLQVTATHTLLEYRPVVQDVDVVHPVFELPPGGFPAPPDPWPFPARP